MAQARDLSLFVASSCCFVDLICPQLEHTQDTQKVMCYVVAPSTGWYFGVGEGGAIRLVSHSADAPPGDGFVVTALTDAEYPRRAALSMCTSIVQEFAIKFPTARAPVAWPQLDQYLARFVAHSRLNVDAAFDGFFSYQDPTEADKLSKIQKDLDETKVPIHVKHWPVDSHSYFNARTRSASLRFPRFSAATFVWFDRRRL
jgi:hypothetical protein